MLTCFDFLMPFIGIGRVRNVTWEDLTLESVDKPIFVTR
jgi:hypothetical protein